MGVLVLPLLLHIHAVHVSQQTLLNSLHSCHRKHQGGMLQHAVHIQTCNTKHHTVRAGSAPGWHASACCTHSDLQHQTVTAGSAPRWHASACCTHSDLQHQTPHSEGWVSTWMACFCMLYTFRPATPVRAGSAPGWHASACCTHSDLQHQTVRAGSAPGWHASACCTHSDLQHQTPHSEVWVSHPEGGLQRCNTTTVLKLKNFILQQL